MRILRSCAMAVAAFALSACGNEPAADEVETAAEQNESSPPSKSCESDGITASGAWVRAARPGQPTTAAYLMLCNGDAADTLVSVTYPGAAAVELHATSMSDDGIAVMTPASSGIALPTGEQVELAPGGAHIMLIGVTYALKEGERLPMTLHFANAPDMEVVFDIRATTYDGGHGED